MFTLFFVSPQELDNSEIEISGSQGRHAISVLRVSIGESIRLANGLGGWVDGEIINITRDVVRVQVKARGEDKKPRVRVSVAQALLKGDNQKLAIDQLVQAGVASIIPWRATRSVGTTDKTEKWREVISTAAKQSRRSLLPEIMNLIDLKSLVETFSQYSIVIALHEGATINLASIPSIAQAESILLIVGPEGGLTDVELDTLSSMNAIVVKMGDPVIRADLAGSLALAATNALVGNW